MKYVSMVFRFVVLSVLTRLAANGIVAVCKVHIITALVATAVMWFSVWAASEFEERQ